jgi:biotin synthase
MQPLALHLANSIFLGDYLTSEGQAGQADLDMIADAGFEVEGAATTTLPAHRRSGDALAAGGSGCGSHESECGACEHAEPAATATATGRPAGAAAASTSTSTSGAEPDSGADSGAGEAVAVGARTDLVSVRRRGAGTDLPPNA